MEKNKGVAVSIIGYLLLAAEFAYFLSSISASSGAGIPPQHIVAFFTCFALNTAALVMAFVYASVAHAAIVSLFFTAVSVAAFSGSVLISFKTYNYGFMLFSNAVLDVANCAIVFALVNVVGTRFKALSTRIKPALITYFLGVFFFGIFATKYTVASMYPNYVTFQPLVLLSLYILVVTVFLFVVFYLLQTCIFPSLGAPSEFYDQADVELFSEIERSLLSLQNQELVFKETAYWIACKLKYAFICILSDDEKHDGKKHIDYFEGEESVRNTLMDMYAERKKKAVSGTQDVLHQNEGISLSCVGVGGKTVVLLLGPKKNAHAYTGNEIQFLRNLMRVLASTLLAIQLFTDRVESDRLRSAFSRYISPEVAHPDVTARNPQLGGSRHIVSLLFSDLRGFTKLTEVMDGSALMRVLNMYLNEMSQIIITLGGTLDKFEGDEIMAFFGAPMSLKDHAQRCCAAALRMKRMEELLNSQLMEEHLIPEPLFTRIGINSGDVIVGNIGSMQRLEYTVIGTNVNIASRVEAANRKYDTAILISEKTYQYVSDSFQCVPVGDMQLSGSNETIRLYELVAEKDSVSIAANASRMFSIDLTYDIAQTDAPENTLKINTVPASAPNDDEFLEELEELVEFIDSMDEKK
ncbi:MAG: hypothetical protein Ta2A_23860 [Treponemataceae bacterium]|nr:MAG: hypothetical protein Ta2A_23860 [Treponemataceae bacterium]